MSRTTRFSAIIFVLQCVIAQPALSQTVSVDGLSPFYTAESFHASEIVDGNNRVLTTVDLRDGTMATFPSTEDPALVGRTSPIHSAQAQNAIAAFERAYGFATVYMTSWVGESFTAYLTAEQVAALRTDPRVAMVSEVVPIDPSVVLPPWANTLHSGTIALEASSWGRTAMNGKISNGTARVYVLDEGVGHSLDNGNVITRVNASCGPYGSVCGPSVPVVGCFGHATHVAGIIGAPYGNLGSAGVDAGVPIVSVAISPSKRSSLVNCADEYTATTATLANGLDYIKWDISTHSYPKLSVVNLSFNGNGGVFAEPSSTFAKIKNLITPAGAYPGVFFAQSAGNDYANACSWAYAYLTGTASTNDGLMVVGGIDSKANPVIGATGYDNSSVEAGLVEPGSNYGHCVDVWAPSKTIYSTWGGAYFYDDTVSSTWQVDGTTYNQYQNLSGTSMAAPHIAGAAAYLIETQSLATPGAVETALRSYYYNVGKVDFLGGTIWMTQLP